MTAQLSAYSDGLTGIILAGGAGQRMGGADKGLACLQGRSMIEYVIDSIKPQVDSIIIVANRNLDSYGAYGYPVHADILPGHAGPLVGILTGLEACPTSHALFVPADAPQLPGDLAERLQARGAPAFVVSDGSWQPLCCLLRRRDRAALRQAVNSGQRSPRQWLQSLGAAPVEFPPQDYIWSVNTLDELQRLQQHPGLAA